MGSEVYGGGCLADYSSLGARISAVLDVEEPIHGCLKRKRRTATLGGGAPRGRTDYLRPAFIALACSTWLLTLFAMLSADSNLAFDSL